MKNILVVISSILVYNINLEKQNWVKYKSDIWLHWNSVKSIKIGSLDWEKQAYNRGLGELWVPGKSLITRIAQRLESSSASITLSLEEEHCALNTLGSPSAYPWALTCLLQYLALYFLLGGMISSLFNLCLLLPLSLVLSWYGDAVGHVCFVSCPFLISGLGFYFVVFFEQLYGHH